MGAYGKCARFINLEFRNLGAARCCGRLPLVVAGWAFAVRPLDDSAYRIADFRVVLAPNVTGRRIAAGCPHCLDDRIRRLDALSLLELAQIVPCRQKNEQA